MNKLGGNIAQGLMGNLSELMPEQIQQQYGQYLMTGERIQCGFVLIRDVVIFTDRRIIDLDKQGATGMKARVTSIYIDSIINVSSETAGFGDDDCELDIEYITSPYFRASGGVTIASRKFEFPSNYPIHELYKALMEVAYANHQRINS